MAKYSCLLNKLFQSLIQKAKSMKIYHTHSHTSTYSLLNRCKFLSHLLIRCDIFSVKICQLNIPKVFSTKFIEQLKKFSINTQGHWGAQTDLSPKQLYYQIIHRLDFFKENVVSSLQYYPKIQHLQAMVNVGKDKSCYEKLYQQSQAQQLESIKLCVFIEYNQLIHTERLIKLSLPENLEIFELELLNQGSYHMKLDEKLNLLNQFEQNKSRLIENLTNLKRLRSLKLRSANRFQSQENDFELKFLELFLMNVNPVNVETLNLKYLDSGEFLQKEEILKRFPNVSDLSTNQKMVQFSFNFGYYLQKLKTLEYDFYRIQELFEMSPIPHLQKIVLAKQGNCNINLSLLNEIQKACPKLESIDLKTDEVQLNYSETFDIILNFFLGLPSIRVINLNNLHFLYYGDFEYNLIRSRWNIIKSQILRFCSISIHLIYIKKQNN